MSQGLAHKNTLHTGQMNRLKVGERRSGDHLPIYQIRGLLRTWVMDAGSAPAFANASARLVRHDVCFLSCHPRFRGDDSIAGVPNG